MQKTRLCLAMIVCLLLLPLVHRAQGATTQKRYYAHNAVEDEYGVIAPWYKGQNGQCDFRVRIAAETLKRYPWVGVGEALTPAPEFVYNGSWKIAPDGKITVHRKMSPWSNGNLVNRNGVQTIAMMQYYPYSGDPAAVSIITMATDFVVDYCQTSADHPWPNFPIAVPTKGKPYGLPDPRGFIQLDIAAQTGMIVARAYKMIGKKKWLEAAKHWGDLFAEKCNHQRGARPWPRYANPEDVPWGKKPNGNIQTGGVVYVIMFLDELIDLGHTGRDNSIVKARDAGRRYLREQLLPKWSDNPTWGYNYWDWLSPVSNQNIVWMTVDYLMDHPDAFPNWQNDVRNILLIMAHRTSVYPEGKCGVYSGAWAHPESSTCCRDSNAYGPQRLGGAYLKYAALTGSRWAREMGRRQILLSTYDARENGVVVDCLLSNKPYVAGGWFCIATTLPIWGILRAMPWLPEALGPNRENHIMQTASIVQSVVYGKGSVCYTTFDAPQPCVDVLRLAFEPTCVKADGNLLGRRDDLKANGYQVKRLPGDDCMLSIRHDGCRKVTVEGDDPQQVADDDQLDYEGDWSVARDKDALGGKLHLASTAGASMTKTFVGNQVRLVGHVDPKGGRADVYVDGVKQLVWIDFWCPEPRDRQIVYYRNGLKPGKHSIKVVARGSKNPRSEGRNVYVDAVQWSAAEGDSGFGSGGGPTNAQRVIFGYTGRKGYVDTNGHVWRPGIEVVARLGKGVDIVAKSWWTKPLEQPIAGTDDPELYRYGVHAPEFWVNVTVGPGTYGVRLKFAERRTENDPKRRPMNVSINGRQVVKSLDVAAKAGGPNKAVDLSFDKIRPKNGTIDIRFTGTAGGEAVVQAIEIFPNRDVKKN